MCGTNYRQLAIVVALLLTSFLTLSGHTYAQTKVVVLKNGNALKGRIELVGDQVEVRTNNTNRLILERSQVDFVSNTFNEAFDVRYAGTAHDDIAGQKALLFWALRYDLYEKAQQQFDEIQLLHIPAHELHSLHRQLTSAINREKTRVEQAKIKTEAAAKTSMLAPIRSTKESVSDIEFTPVPPTDPSAEPAANPAPEDRFAELRERMEMNKKVTALTKGLAGRFVAKYKRQIEPNLIQGCYAAGCHDQAQTEMPLLAMGKFKDVPKQMSRRNLYQVMQHVDTNDPLQSQLFQNATQPHGGLTKPIFDPESPQYGNLKRWLTSLANSETLARYQAQEFAEQQAAQRASLAKTTSAIAPATAGNSAPGLVRQVNAELPDSDLPSIPDLTPQARLFEPKDPFDPEIFNRRYGKQNK